MSYSEMAQLELMSALNSISSEAELNEFKDLVAMFFAAKAQKEIDALDEELANLEAEETENTITSNVDGRIKKIYVKEGTAVSSTMYDKDALMLISIDGYMAVDIDTDKLKKGDSVMVTDSKGKEYERKYKGY